MTSYNPSEFGFATRAIHAGQDPEELTGAVTVPLYQTSTYAQEAIGQHKGFEYARTQNPTRFAWEASIANLEQGNAGFAFGSGMAAVNAVVTLLSAGDHIVCAEDMYGGTFRLFDKVIKRFGLEFSVVDMTSKEAVEAAIIPGKTKMLYTESPTNPMMKLTDLKMLAELAHHHHALLVVDNTFASPYFQKPITLGADIVLHSATKYLGGHSDLVSGVVIAAHENIAHELRFIQNAAGAVPGPFECWLCLRSVKTLAIRMNQHEANAKIIADYCEHHPMVIATHYPGLQSHPQHALAKEQMSGFGGMISIELGTLEKAKAFTNAVRLFTLAESLGGVESLVCHPVSMTHGSIPKEQREKLGITDSLVRLSVGIENIDDLLKDIAQALESLH
ncbi:MAG: trans-sulfuration enzyme family protein [Bacteroidota bacterium]